MPCLVKLSVVPVVNRGCLNGMGSWMKGKSGRLPLLRRLRRPLGLGGCNMLHRRLPVIAFAVLTLCFLFVRFLAKKKAKSKKKYCLCFLFVS